jgi:hypothetical protein
MDIAWVIGFCEEWEPFAIVAKTVSGRTGGEFSV